MKKLMLIFFMHFLMMHVGLAQNSLADSLKRKLAIAKQDTSRLMLMNKLTYYYRLTKPDSAFSYNNKALQLAQKIHSPYWDASTFISSGFVYRETGNLPKALELATSALRISKEGHFATEEGAYILLGTIYHDLNEQRKALMYSGEALKMIQKRKGEKSQALLNIGLCYLELNENDAAKRYLDFGYEAFNSENIENKTYLWRDFGQLQLNQGNYPLALNYLKKSVQAASDHSDNRNAAFSYVEIAIVFEKTRQADSVIFYAKIALEHAQAGPFNLFVLKATGLLANAYELKGDFKNALIYEKLAATTKESLFGAGNIKAMQLITEQEQQHQRQIEITKQAYQNKLWRYGLLTGVVVLLVIAFILFRNNRQKHKANEVLANTLKNLQQTQTQLIQSEKMASLGELTAGIAHEIQNPLNFVNNFSEVSVELLQELKDEAAAGNKDEVIAIADDLTQNLEKISHHGKRADFIVKGMLQHSRVGTGEKQQTDINKLADEYLRLAYHGLRAKDKNFNAELITNFDETLPIVNAVQQDISRVLLNLFNNAFYAVNEKKKTASADYKPEVTVSTSSTGKEIVIMVKDNGNGIPDAIKDKIMQPFFTTKPTGEGTGLGLSLSYDIVVKGHGGSISIDSRESEGAEFVVNIPI
jgi:two-component system NtrC family sensor kinase